MNEVKMGIYTNEINGLKVKLGLAEKIEDIIKAIQSLIADIRRKYNGEYYVEIYRCA